LRAQENADLSECKQVNMKNEIPPANSQKERKMDKTKGEGKRTKT